LATFEEGGAQVEDVRIADIEYEPAVFATVLGVEMYAFHRRQAAAQPELFGRSFYGRLLAGSMFSAADYAHALRGRSLVCAGSDEAMASVDVLALPTRGRPP